MTLPYIFAGTCIVFLLICMAAYANDKKIKKQQLQRAKSQPVRYRLMEEDRTLLLNLLQAKNYNRLIAYLIDDALPGHPFRTSQIVKMFNLSYSHAGQITDQMEYLGLISPANDGKRSWLVSRHSIQDIAEKIEATQPYQI